jgi:hypothetical protein
MIAAITNFMACVFYYISAGAVREEFDRQKAEGVV